MLAAAQQLDSEGLVAKRKADPHRPETTWYKVKNQAYTLKRRVGGSSSTEKG